jgi:PP-loop superfamily ATP-utilizing enzyme
MTPKEKAEQLINAFVPHVMWKMGQEDVIQRAKECALIAVDEISEHCYQVMKPFWQEVKQEIEKL